MAQFARPDADQAVGLWTATPLWSKVDDDLVAQPSGDGVVITSSNNTNPDNADLRLSDVTDPAASTGHILRARWNKNDALGHNINAVAELWQGVPGTGTLIATLTVNGIGSLEQEDSLNLAAGQADAITDYADLYVRVSRQGDTGGQGALRRSLVAEAVELEVPDATGAIEGSGAVQAGPFQAQGQGGSPASNGSMSFAGAAALVADIATLYELTGQTEVVAEVTAQTSVTNVQQLLVGKLNDGSSSHDCWVFFGLSNTASRWRLRQSNTTLRAWSLGTGGYIDTSRHVYRVDFDASLKRATWFKDGSQVGSAVDLADWDSTYNTSSTAPARIGAAGNSDGSGLSSAFTGDIEKVTVYTDLARTTKLFEIDFTNPANGSQTTDPWDTWTDSNGNTWTMVGTGWTYNDPTGAIEGSGAVQAGPFSASGDGDVLIAGDGAASPAAFQAQGSGDVVITGSGTAQAGPFNASGSGVVGWQDIEGSGAADLPAFQAAGDGNALVAGDGSATTGAFQASGSGAVVVSGQGSAQAGPFNASGQGGSPATNGSGSADLPAFQVSGEGDVLVTGDGAAQAGPFAASGEADAIISGAGEAQAGPFSVSGSGNLDALESNGDGAVQAGPFQASGTGDVVVTGSGAVQAGPFQAQGQGGSPASNGTGEATAGPFSVQGAGTVEVGGSGSATLPAFTADGSGTAVVGGDGIAILGPAFVDGEGAVVISGSGAVTLAAFQVAGVGGSTAFGTPVPGPTGFRGERGIRKAVGPRGSQAIGGSGHQEASP